MFMIQNIKVQGLRFARSFDSLFFEKILLNVLSEQKNLAIDPQDQSFSYPQRLEKIAILGQPPSSLHVDCLTKCVKQF